MFRVSSSFETRLRRIERQHRRLARGSVAHVLEDGLIVQRPRPRHGAGHALIALVLFPLLVALGAKSFLLARLDAAALAETLSRLESAGPMGRAIIWAMQPESVTAFLSQALARALG